MRILLCAAQAPTLPMNGERLIVAELWAQLARRHDVQLVTLVHRDQRVPDGAVSVPWRAPGRGARLAAIAHSSARGRCHQAELVSGALAPALERAVAAWQPDVVLAISELLAPVAAVLGDCPRVLAYLDAWQRNHEASLATARRPARAVRAAQLPLIRAFERREYARWGALVAVSPQDRDAVLAGNPRLNIHVVPNGVDAARLLPWQPQTATRHRIVFHGVMDYPPNVAAARLLAEEVLPRVRARRPRASLALVGRSPAPAVRALAAQPGVMVTGAVPDVAPWLAGSRAFACPMVTGTGIKNKLLEALASGVPSVATPLALQGLAVTPGRDLLVGDDPDALADALVRLLDDDALAAEIGAAGRERVLECHTWEAAARAYEDVLTSEVTRCRSLR